MPQPALPARAVRRGMLAASLAALALAAAPAAGGASPFTLPAIDFGAPTSASAVVRATFATVADEPASVDWKMLGNLDYVNGKVPESLKKLDGKLVKIPGFVVPLEDYEEEGAEFLLVPYFGACVHTPPPPPNQMVYVRMQGGKKIKFGWWDPVWMEGTLKIEHFESPYGAAGFQLTGMKVTPYKA